MAKKVILKDLNDIEVLPITRGELILDASGNLALHSTLFLATDSLPGLMSSEDKYKLDHLEDSGPGADNKVAQINTTTNDVYRLLFSETADDTDRTEKSRKSAKLTFNPSTGVLQTTALIGNLDGTYVNRLTGYTKATTVAGITSEDSLNTALGKLELKADTTYDLVRGAYDGDGTIENLAEILKVLEGISDTETIQAIVGKYLPLSGGTLTGALIISGGADRKIVLDNTDAETNWSLISFRQNGVEYGYLGTVGDTNLKWNSNTLIHSGNIGSYAFIPRDTISSNTDANNLQNGVYLNGTGNGTGNSNFPQTYSIISHFTQSDSYQSQISIGNPNVYVRRKIDTWSEWVELITNKNIGSQNAGSATKLVNTKGYTYAITYNTDKIAVFGDVTAQNGYKTYLDGTSISLRYGTTNATGFILNSLGNVTIGSSDRANASFKLFAEGPGAFEQADGTRVLLEGGVDGNGGGGLAFFDASGFKRGTITAKPLILNAIGGGNVLIGTTTDSGTKLYVSGDTRFDGQARINGSMRFYGKTNLSSDMYIDNQSVGGLNFAWSDGNSRFFIGDNIGIGTTDPAYRLDVNGIIHASEFKSLVSSDHYKMLEMGVINGRLLRVHTAAGIQGVSGRMAALSLYEGESCYGSIGVTTTGPVWIDGMTTRYELIHSGNIGSYALTQHQSLANYVTLDSAQTITGVKTFASNTFILAGREHSDIKHATQYAYNWGGYGGTNNTPNYTGMYNSLDFQWYGDTWSIGNLRSSGSTTNGFGIGLKKNDNNGDLYFAPAFRITETESYINNNKVWHAGNDGSGSGLDADLLDGYHAKSFIRFDNGNPEYLAARFIDTDFSTKASEKYIEFWSSPGWYNSMWGKVIAQTGFYKSGSSNDYVLLGEGGHKALSEFSMAHSHPYLPFYLKTAADCNSYTEGLTVVSATDSTAAHTNHSAFLTIINVGTPFQLQLPDSSINYIYKRYKSGSTWSAWSKLSAGYADSAAYADRLGKTWIEDINYTYGSGSSLKIISNSTGTAGNFASGWQSGISVISDYVGWQLTSYGGDEQNPYFRSLQDTGTWKPWRKLAFLDDNVASATKLHTARMLWGQSFDGTGDISGSIDNCNWIRYYKGGSVSGYIVGRGEEITGGDGLGLWTYGNTPIFLGTGATQRMIVDSSGNVGIGTTSPRYELDVNGSIRANGNVLLEAANSTTGGGIAFWNASGWVNGTINAKNLILNYAGGNVGIGTLNPSCKLEVNGSLKISDYIDIRESGGKNRFTAYVYSGIGRLYSYNDDSGYNDLYVGQNSTSAIVIKANGKVGIGDANPTSKLSVKGSIDTYNDGNYSGVIGFNRKSSTGGLLNTSYHGHQIHNYKGDLQFFVQKTDNTTLIPITIIGNSGNVGIGTTSPISKLHLYSTDNTTLRIQSDGSGGDQGAICMKKASGNGLVFAVENRDFIWQVGASSATGDGTERMRLTNSGNVGIGTTSPAYKLDVNGTAKATSLMSSNIRIECDNNGVLGSRGSEINNYNGHLHLNHHSGTHIIMATGGGNVGIGTGNPAYKLDVSGTAKANKVLIYDGTNAVLSLRTTTAGEYAYLAAYNTGGQYGADVVLHSGSAMVLGAGESAASMYDNNVDSLRGSENLYLTADLLVKIFTNCDSIGNRRHAATFTTDGYSFFHSYINIGGHEKNASSPSYVWGSNSSDNYLRSYLTSSLSVGYAGSSTVWSRTWQRGNNALIPLANYHNQTRVFMVDSDTSNRPNSSAGFIIANAWDWGGGGSLIYQDFDTDYGRLFTNAKTCDGSYQGWKKVAWTTDIPTTMAWSSITGKPSTFTPSTHYHNYFPENTAVYFRDPNNASWRGGMYWGSAGNEALCFAVVNANTSFRFFTGSDLANWTSSTWQGTPAFEVNKNGAYAPHFYENSDAKLKENIQAILDRDNIPQIKEFDWKESGEHSYGLIAQELEEQGYSELVSTKDDGYKTVNYSAALSLIVGKLQVKIKELEKEIENLKNKN